jgi:PAS domain S-box-containing protein
MSELTSGDERPRLWDFIEQNRPRILAAWEQEVRSMPVARELSRQKLLDHLPELLNRIAKLVRTVHEPGDEDLADLPQVHALDRLDVGFDLGEVASEYSRLRSCVLRLYEKELDNPQTQITVEEVDRFNRAVDESVVVAVESYARARERTLVALDRISSAALETSDVDAFLPRLLRVVLESLEAVDSTTILLRDGDELYVKESIGLEEEKRAGWRLKIGEGFAGTIARTRKPLTLRFAANDPLVKSPFLKNRGTRALYGVPLLDGDELLGVVHVGSRSAFEFSQDDLLLIRTMANRATALLVEARLREAERRAREAAEVERAKVDALLAGAPAGVAIFDPELRFQKVNEAAASLTAHSAAELVGKRLDEAISPEDFAQLRPSFEQVLRTGEPVTGLEIRRQRPFGSGNWHTLMAHLFPVKLSQQTLGVGLMTVDITDRKRAEEEQRRAGEFRERFIGIVSHDLRNPLGTIKMGVGRLAQAEDLPERLAKVVGRIGSAADRMTRMISDLLDFTRSRIGGGIPVALGEVNLRHLARHLIEELEIGHPDRAIELEAVGDFRGEWDADRITQVISNLAKNALDYGRPGAPVRIRLIDQERHVGIEVHNEGDPIPPDLLPHIFRLFTRGRPQEPGSGLGLGLYIARKIVEAHGGTLSARSTREEGTTFLVELPRHPGGERGEGRGAEWPPTPRR